MSRCVPGLTSGALTRTWSTPPSTSPTACSPPEQLEEFAALTGDELRTAFLEMMHFHHNHVIKMTQDEVDRGGYEPLREMAKEMIEVQTAEMGEMEELLGYTP